jgi:hypothetical protein
MIVLSVSKTYWNRGVKTHRKKAKRIWLVYYLDEDDEFKLRTKRISVLEVPYYKAQILHKRVIVCKYCKRCQYHFVKNDKELEKRECVYEDCRSNEAEFDASDNIDTLEEPKQTSSLAVFLALSLGIILLLRYRRAAADFFDR